MGKITTDWILNLGESKSSINELVADVNNYNTAVDKAVKGTNKGFSDNAKAAQQFNSELTKSIAANRKVEDASRSVEQQVRSLIGTYGFLTKEQNKFTAGSSEYNLLQAKIDATKTKIKDLGGSFNDAGNKAEDFDTDLERIIKDFDKTEKEAAKVQAQLAKLGQVYNRLKTDRDRFAADSPAFKGIQSDINRVESEIKGLGGTLGGEVGKGAAAAENALEGVGQKAGGLSGIIGKLGPILGAVFAVGTLISFGQMILDITAKFQVYEAVLTNTLGSSLQAGKALNMIQEIAAKTPFSVDQLTESYVKLVNSGFKPTRDQIIALGDVASSTGKGIDQLTEAIIDAQTGEFERLKEFGIKASQANGKVTFTFKEQQTVVNQNASEIRDYIVGLGKLQGVSGSMAAISQTLTGKISNLGDNFDRVLRIIGNGSNAVLGAFIDAASAAVTIIGDLFGGQEKYSDSLLKEQTRVEELAIKITSLNVGNKERTALIKELQGQYPDFLKNINAETVSNEELSKAIDKVTESLVNRILIQREEEKIKEQAEKTADAQEKRARALIDITKSLNAVYKEREGRIAVGGKAPLIDETGDRNTGVDVKQGNLGLPLDAQAGRTLALFNQGRLAVTSYSQGIQDLQKALKDYISADEKYQGQLGKSNDLVQKKRALMEVLGISQEKLNDLEGEGGKKLIELTKEQRNQIDLYRKLIDAARDYKTALTAAEVAKLNKAILAAQVKADKERAAALKDLLKELDDLEKKAQKAKLDDLDKSGKEYQAELLKQALAEIALIEKTIKAKEKVYAKKGGKGANADGQLNPEQQKQIDILKQAARNNYADAILAIDQASAARILDLQKDSDAKELAQAAAKYDKEIALAKKAKNDKLVVALEEAKALELAKIGRAQAGKNLDAGEGIAVELAKKTQGTFVVEDPDTKNGAAALAKAAVGAEERKQKAILNIQIEYAKKRLALLAGNEDDESTLQRLKLDNLITDLQKQLGDIDKKAPKFDLMKLMGVRDEDRGEVEAAFSEFTSVLGQQINDFVQQQLDAANQVVEKRKEEVDEKESDLQREIDLNKQGFASNVETKRAELEEARKNRAAALEDQKKAAKAQAAVETVQQTIGLITSSINIIEGFSKIPIIGLPLGIAAVAAMFGFFVAAKAKAASAAKLEKGGWIGGKRHSQGGNKFVAADGSGMEHEAGEFAVNRTSAAKYAEELEALNRDDEKSFRTLSLRHLLKGTGVRLSDDAPKRLEARKTAHSNATQAAAQATEAARLDRIERHLEGIRANTRPLPTVTELADRTIIQDGDTTRIIHKK